MKRRNVKIYLAVAAGLILAAGAITGALTRDNAMAVGGQTPANSLYVCAMHPWQTSYEPGSCPICGMQLSQVEGYQADDPVPDPDHLVVNPDNPMQVSVVRHEGWIPIRQSPIYQPPEDHGESGLQGMMEENSGRVAGGEKQLWTCGMHPQVIQDHPGNCPICNMNLVPLKRTVTTTRSADAGGRRIKYWVAPMDPAYTSDKPGKSPMGMDLVPVYEDDVAGGSAVSIDPATLQNIGVVTAPVKRSDISRVIRTNGTVEIAEENEVTANVRIGGWVEKLYVNQTGIPVRKGQRLLEIYSPELVSAQEDFILALKNADALRSSSLEHVARGGEDLAASARRRLQLWNIPESEISRLERTREVNRTVPLEAPASGIVMEKNIVEGAAVKPGMDLFRIADLSRVWVQTQIYEDELPWVHQGDAVTVSSPYDPDLKLNGAVDYIYPVVDPKSRTADARIVLSNSTGELKPDMYLDVLIAANPVKDAVTVPKSAVIRSGKRDIVFVKVGEGLFEPREVKLGVESDRDCQVTANLQPGEQVVVKAQFLLDSEAKLQEAIQRRIEQQMTPDPKPQTES